MTEKPRPKRDGYFIDNGEYVSPNPSPQGNLPSDPIKVERLKARTRERILNRES